MRADEVKDDRAREIFDELFEPIRVAVAPFAGFVLALMLGRVLAGESVVRIDELVFGLPLAWLVGWMGTRKWEVAWIAAATVLALVGLAIGLLDPG